MRVDELDIPDTVSDLLMSAGFRELHPPQAEAIPIALERRNLVAAIPTASGKSLIGMIPALKLLSERRGKILYIVPLKALAAEKKDDFQRFADSMGFKVHLSTGDLDGEDKGISDADVVVATSEKTDSMIRHGSRWIEEIRLVIADEIHLIHEPGRGPTLEIALTKLMRKLPEMQIIALSATISNAYDLASWLHADLVRSDWRPVPLHEGVYLDGTIKFDDGRTVEVPGKGDEIENLVIQTIKEGGQCLVFVNSRRSTEAVASRISHTLASLKVSGITPQEKTVLEGESEATDMGRNLSIYASKGVAFHNAGLTYSQRRVVESSFKAGRIKCIVATPTLAAGINLPARRVIVRDTHRFDNGGNVPISVMEVKQMCGRAGRPGYDPYGEAVLMAKNLRDSDHLFEDYIEHETETVRSKLFSGNAIKGHILGILATGDAKAEDDIVDFIRDTFFGSTSQLLGIESVVTDSVDYLVKEQMVRRNGECIEVLPFGKRVSDLCIDPVSAAILRDAVMKIDDDTKILPILIAAAMTPDVMGMFPKKADQERIKSTIQELDDELLVRPEELEDYMPNLFGSDVKVALLLKDWISEVHEEIITKTMGIGPGDIRSKVDMMDWIIYAMSEIAYIFNPDAIRRIRPLTTRVRYGVKEELVDLVSLRGVGRSRARRLYDAGFRSRADIAGTDVGILSSMPGIGPSLAASMVRQAGGSEKKERYTPPSEEESMLDEMAAAYGEPPMCEESQSYEKKDVKAEETGPKQASLFDFRSLREDPLDVGDRVPALYGRGAVVDDGVGVLETVPGADAHDTLVPVDDSLRAELPESGDGCRGCGLDADALLPSEKLLGADDLLIVDRRRIPSGGIDGLQSLPSTDRVPDPDGGGHGLRVILGDEIVGVLREGLRDGRSPLGLNSGEHRDLVDPSDLLELHACLVDGPDVGGVAHGQDDPVRNVVSELVHDLEEDGLLSLGPVRVDGVEQIELLLLGHPPRESQSVIEVAVDGQDLGSEEQGLGQLAHGDLPRRKEHGALHACLGRIRRESRGRVTGGCASDDLGSELVGAGDPDGHSAVLERTCGVEALELDERVHDSDLCSEGPGRVEGGPSFLNRHLVSRVDRHERSVSPDPHGSRAEILRLHLLDGLEIHLDGQETAAPGAGVDERVVDLGSAIPADNFVCCHIQILLQPEPGSVIQVSHFISCSEYILLMLSAICSPSWELLS